MSYSTEKKGSYLSKRGYVLRKENIQDDTLRELKKELKGRPLQDAKYNQFNQMDSTFPLYIETKNKIYIPKMYGLQKFGPPENELDNYKGEQWENDIEFSGVLREYQNEPIDALLNNLRKDTSGGILCLGTGQGKCLAKDTPILMFDGAIKPVQDVQVGDLLMGDDSTARRVLSLARGIDDMYDVIPVKGDKYTVNKEHILVLRNTRKVPFIKERRTLSSTVYDVYWWENFNEQSIVCQSMQDAENKCLELQKQHQDVITIPVKEYIHQSQKFHRHFQGYKVPIEFDKKYIPLDPYMLGYWLGDDTSSNFLISSQDSSVLKYFANNLSQYKCYLQFAAQDTYDYRINGIESKRNYFTHTLCELDVLNNKHIPMLYKCNTREVRLQTLAGLLDANGRLGEDGVCYDLIQKSEKLTDDIIYICRSLGFACYKNVVQQNECRITISGDTYCIPTKIPRKQARRRMQVRDHLMTEITVQHVGRGDYYGFTLDGNRRFVLGDFTVTHNTISCINVLSRLKVKTLVIVNKISLLKQWEDEINTFLPDARVGIIQGQKNVDVDDKDIVIAMLQSLAKVDYPDSLFHSFGCTVVDEVHNIASRVFSTALMKVCSKYTIGLSATPKRSDGCEYVFKWFIGDIVYQSKSERKGLPPVVNTIKMVSDDYKEIATINKINGQKQIQFTSMLSDLIQMPKRNKLLIEMIIHLVKNDGRRVLVMSDRREHVKELKSILDSDKRVDFTYGLFLGQMKISDLEKSKASQVILATYQAFGEGVSEKDLDTLILTTPKKFIGHLKAPTKNESGKLEQIVGRIFRKEHKDRSPMIIDLHDHFSVYKNQSRQRMAFYKEHFSNVIFREQTIDLDKVSVESISMDNLTTTKEHTAKNVYQECLL
jgi:superfamily II DNA or RNA helicase